MASSKETPRQKMIGMMYLVLTCMLAMNVSNEVLKGFITVNESLERTNANFGNNTEAIMHAFKDAVNSGHPEVMPYYKKAEEVSQLTKVTYDYLAQLKAQVQLYTERSEGADTMQLRFVERTDDYDRPTYFLLGSDETHPKPGPNTAVELRSKLNDLAGQLDKMVEEMHNNSSVKLHDNDYAALKQRINGLRPSDPNQKEDGVLVTWERQNFYHLPLAAVITNLSKMQSDVLSMQSEMVSTLAGASGKIKVNFDQLRAQVVPRSDYVQVGQPYTADVFLAAASSDFSEDNMQIVVGSFDTLTGKPSTGSTILPIDQGTGKILFPSSAAGTKDYKGMIRFKDGTGRYRYLDFKNEYVVANPSTAVSPLKMNVFYAGVSNPISVSAAGIAPTDLIVNINGCGGALTPKGNGTYEATATSVGQCTITVSAKTKDGIRQQGAPMVFRVKKIPTPQAKFGRYSGNGILEIPALELKGVTQLGVDIGGFDFQATFSIESFDVDMKKGSDIQAYSISGNKLSPELMEDLKKAKHGTKIFISNIIVKTPTGAKEPLPGLTLRVK